MQRLDFVLISAGNVEDQVVCTRIVQMPPYQQCQFEGTFRWYTLIMPTSSSFSSDPFLLLNSHFPNFSFFSIDDLFSV